MTVDRIANVAAAIVGVALATTLVSSRNTAGIIRSLGSSFSGALRAAMGR